MTPNQCDIGLIGLAVMGENLVLNMESKGFSVAVFNRTTEVTDRFAARRGKELENRGIHFVGCGVSGGEEGALKGPSLMPGGSRESWEIIAPIFRKIAAQVDGEPCCRYMGPDGAGHYVKMVHNGIEYGDIQLICEAYAILKDILEMQAAQLAEVFAEWNTGELDSYLIQITSEIFRKIDPDTGRPLVDMILDKAGQKG